MPHLTRAAVVIALIGACLFAALATTQDALAQRPPQKTFVAVLSAAEEVPLCAPAGLGDRGVAIFHVVNQATGEVRFLLVSTDLPGTNTAAHIHIGPPGMAGPVVQGLAPPFSSEQGVIASGTFTNLALVTAMQANPGNYYVNIHSTVCPPGVIRGQIR